MGEEARFRSAKWRSPWRPRRQALNVAALGLGPSFKARLRRRQLIRRAFAFYLATCLTIIGGFGYLWLRDRGLVRDLGAHLMNLPAPPPYYPDCRTAHGQGVYSIPRGTAGYREKLDADGDGLACEPYIAGPDERGSR